MPAPRYRSRSKRRVYVRTPGSRVKLHYRKRKPSKAKCGNCGALLKGVPRDIKSKFRNLAKTKKRPNRAYGGNLCSKCSKEKLKEKAGLIEFKK